MANDFKKAQPTKSERMIAELAMQQEMMARDVWTISSNVIALGVLLKVDPKKIAEMLVDDTQVKEYAQKINAAIREIEDKKRAENPQAEGSEPKHEHNHDHSDTNHTH